MKTCGCLVGGLIAVIVIAFVITQTAASNGTHLSFDVIITVLFILFLFGLFVMNIIDRS